MKIKPEHLERMRVAVQKVLDINLGAVERYERGNFPRADMVKDLQKRFCFDLMWAVRAFDKELLNDMYAYMDDGHIYTALKKICPKVERKY